jgi:hypothetical protein
MKHRHAIAAIFAASLVVPAHAATVVNDPAKFVTDVYAHIVKDQGNYQEPQDVYTPRLKALMDLDSKEAGGEVGRLDFDPWTNAQDNSVKDVKVVSHDVEDGPTRKIVVATFTNISTREEIHFYFEKTAQGWKIDDMRSAGKDTPWVLSLILKYGWEQ